MGEARTSGVDGASRTRRAWWRTGRRVRSLLLRRGITDADLAIASYPRSGNLWVRHLLLQLTHGDATHEQVIELVPYVGRHSRAPQLLPRGGRLIKTHERDPGSYPRAIHLVRDPRDVVISYFKFMQHRGSIRVQPGDESGALERFLVAFIDGRLDPHGTWLSHARAWLRAQERRGTDIHRVRYEDLRRDPMSQLTRICEWAGINASPIQIERAVEGSTTDRVRESAREWDARWNRRAGRSPGQFAMVNAGSVGGWREVLTESQAARFAAFDDGLRRLGYEPALVSS